MAACGASASTSHWCQRERRLASFSVKSGPSITTIRDFHSLHLFGYFDTSKFLFRREGSYVANLGNLWYMH